MTLPALLIAHDAICADAALAKGARGARKILVTTLCEDKEREANHSRWSFPDEGEKCPVQTMSDTEVAYFNQHAAQDRHYHQRGTEIYLLIEGRMNIEVSGSDYQLFPGDMIVVNPGAPHKVKSNADPFLCMVVAVNCGGAADKYIVADSG